MAPDSPAAALRAVRDRHAHGAPRPLGGYAALLAGYSGMLGGMVVAGRRLGRPLPERPPAADLALLTVATYRLSRLVTKDSVTAVLRAPLTRYEEPAGEGEVNESVTAPGAGHALGELVTCPFCVSVWLASVLSFGLVVAPKPTRLAAGTLSAVTGSDFLQLAFAAARSRAG